MRIPKKMIVLMPQDDARKNRSKYYRMKQWRDLSKWYMRCHPLCEECLKNGEDKDEVIVNAADAVHHIQSPFESGLDEAMTLKRLLDPNNLMSLCNECHSKIHNEELAERKQKLQDKITNIKPTRVG